MINGEHAMKRRRGRQLPRVMSDDEAERLLGQVNPRSVTGLRNMVGLTLMLRMGLRVSEVCNLSPGDVDLDKRSLHVHRGKGANDRVLFFDPQTLALASLWLERRPKGSRYLLPVIRSGRRGLGQAKPGRRMSPRYLRDLVARLAEQAGIQKQISPHTLRHTFATNELRRGVPIHQLQADLGHSDLSTTAVYLHVVDREREASANGRPPMDLPVHVTRP
jgi:integrase/recombinase XerD